MDRPLIAIVTDDRAYGQALSRGIGYRTGSFMMTVHRRDEFLRNWKSMGISYRRRFDLILWDGGEGERIRGDNILWISDRYSEDAATIYRYDTASAIRGRLIEYYVDKTGKNMPRSSGSDTRIIAFASWQGGAGCTTICQAVGRELSRFYGKRVLYVTMDSIEGGPEEREVRGVDYFLYKLFSDEENEGIRSADGKSEIEIESFLIRDSYGLYRLGTSSGRNPIPNLNRSEVEKLIDAITGSGGFDVLLFDLGSCSFDGAAPVIARADKLCLVERYPQPERRRRYMNWVGDAAGKDLMDRVIRVSNFCEEDPGDRTIPGRNNGSDHIGISMMKQRDDEMVLEGEFGKSINALTESLWYNKITQYM